MSNAEIVQRLSDGYTVQEIAVEFSKKYHFVRDRIKFLKEMCNCKTAAHLVAAYFRKGLIN